MLRYALISLLAVGSVSASAAQYGTTGTVTMIQSQDPSVVNTYFPGSAIGDWFSINAFTAAGNCGKYAITGQVVLEVKNDVSGRRQYTTALTAMTLGRTVTVTIDDTNRDANGYCYVVAMHLN